MSDYQVHEWPNNVDNASQSGTLPIDGFQSSSLQTESLVNASRVAPRIEYLETQNTSRNEYSPTKINFRIEHDDCLVRVYTGFILFWPSTTSLVQLLMIDSTESHGRGRSVAWWLFHGWGGLNM